MANNIFPKSMQRTGKSHIETSTLRGFGGGWNAIDDDFSMAARYAKEITNMFRTPSGAQKVRHGTRWFTDIKSVRNSPILDMAYFNGALIVVTVSGNVEKVTDAGIVSEIWNTAVAAALPGAPAAWSTSIALVSFVPFKSSLIIHNGVDKPIIISSAFAVTYLQDTGTGSNVNVPIGKYGCVAANYHCVSGFTANPTEIVISATGTSGTFPGDPAPNDSISIDVGAYAPEGAATIRGIAGFRSYLIVFLQGVSIQVQLGDLDTNPGTHTPHFPDTFPKFGLIGSRCITNIENDLIFAGLGGFSSARRNLYSTTLDSSYISNIIEPEYRRIVGNISAQSQQTSVFSVYDPLARNLILVINAGTLGTCLVYTSNEKLNYKAWSKFSDLVFRSGCTSFLGRVFLSSNTKIFQLGNDTFGEQAYADRLDDRDLNWAQNTAVTAGQLVRDTVTNESYTVLVSHTIPVSGTFATERTAQPTYYSLYEGIPITFSIELPWFEGKDPMRTKFMRFVSASTKGTAEFTVECYVDNLYKDYNGVVTHTPALSLTMIGNDAPGYGLDDIPYGGGRRSKDARLMKFPAKFKAAKFRITGSVSGPLEIISFSWLFSRGKYFR